MKILKASAGSGKTYRLSEDYRRLILDSKEPHHYRHVLAVTFTNKATAEMKSRILRDLYRSSFKDPKAKQVLGEILNDYSSFAVSTIDRFFQQVLRAFAKELGRFPDYRIELEKKALIKEAMDRILDGLTEDKKEIIDWIYRNMADALNQGKRFSIESLLYDMGKELKSEEHREKLELHSIDELSHYNKERLDRIRELCAEEIKRFEKEFGAFANKSKGPGKPIELGKTALKKDENLAERYHSKYPNYLSMFAIRDAIFSLGLASEFYHSFDELLNENNVLCIDESNTLLRDIINGSDAPFVYEKLGVRYENFLLDEFQDTSKIQWDNFLPLLKESEAKGGFNLVVGDVKQSIYRFRNSDWELLSSKLEEEFPGSEVEKLQYNWRSCRAIVEFNNAFFKDFAQKAGPEIAKIYGDVDQIPQSRDTQEGFVRVSFMKNEEVLEAVHQSIQGVIDSGAHAGDIAILVRDRIEGTKLATYLVEKGIPVISSDALNLKSSLIVRELVALMTAYERPDDKVNDYIVKNLNVEFPEACHSLVDFCEALLRSLKAVQPETFEGEIPFIQAFMDDLLSWTSVYGNNLRAYIKHWEELNLQISSPEGNSAVQIMTIHKAKGLEFPYVIFPFAEKVTMYKHQVRWCYLNAGKFGINADLEGLYPVELTKGKSPNSCFAEDYSKEKMLQSIDSANLFYVALTRAVNGLHIICEEPSQPQREHMEKGCYGELACCSNYLYSYLEEAKLWTQENEAFFGKEYKFSHTADDENSSQEFASSYDSISLNSRLVPSSEALRFFEEREQRVKGIVLHEILSRVDSVEDVEKAVKKAVNEGKLESEEASEVSGMFGSAVSSHPQWFPKDRSKVFKERGIVDSDGREYRPDRVIVEGDEVTIIDFKFGKQQDSYADQLRSYATLYESLGYKLKSGVVWYVKEGKYQYVNSTVPEDLL